MYDSATVPYRSVVATCYEYEYEYEYNIISQNDDIACMNC